VTYIGDLQDLSGVVEVGLAMHDENSIGSIAVIS